MTKAEWRAGRVQYQKEQATKRREHTLAVRRRRAEIQESYWKERASLAHWRNGDAIILSSEKRRARMAAVVSDLTDMEWKGILEYFNHACAYCLVTGVTLHMDHIIPIARGGNHTASNVVPACPQCNAKKNAKTLFAFLFRNQDLPHICH